MDPVSLAITTALSTAAAEELSKIAQSAISDSYNAIKAIIKKKYGKGSDLDKAVENLEEKPESAGRKISLEEEVVSAGADKDKELLEIVKSMMLHLNSTKGETKTINVEDSKNVAIADRGGTASVSVKQDTKD